MRRQARGPRRGRRGWGLRRRAGGVVPHHRPSTMSCSRPEAATRATGSFGRQREHVLVGGADRRPGPARRHDPRRRRRQRPPVAGRARPRRRPESEPGKSRPNLRPSLLTRPQGGRPVQPQHERGEHVPERVQLHRAVRLTQRRIGATERVEERCRSRPRRRSRSRAARRPLRVLRRTGWHRSPRPPLRRRAPRRARCRRPARPQAPPRTLPVTPANDRQACRSPKPRGRAPRRSR